MRDSLIQFLEVCFNVKVFLKQPSFVFYFYEDGCYADFKQPKIHEPKVLNKILQGFDYIIFSHGDELIIRVFENYED